MEINYIFGGFMENNFKILEPRSYSFYSNDFNMDTVENLIGYMCSRGNFKEVCKAFREVCYDQVAYWGDDSHSPIYDNLDKYSELDIENINFLQKKISTVVDLYTQMLVQGNHFDRSYLESCLGR